MTQNSTLNIVRDWLKCLFGRHDLGYATQIFVRNPDGHWYKVCKRCRKEIPSGSS